MATPTVLTTNLTRITGAEAADSANWADIASGPGSGQVSDFFIQGSECRGRRISNNNRGMWYDNGSGIDLTGQHVYMWIQVTTAAAMLSLANGGLEIRIGTDTSNWSGWYVDGSDTYFGGWKRYVIDPSKSATSGATGGSGLTITSAQFFGAFFRMNTAGGNIENCLIDAIDYGTGLIVRGGAFGSSDPIDWQGIADIDGSNSNQYGVIQARSGVFFCLGELQIGETTGTNETYFEDFGKTLVWEERYYHDGTSIVTSLSTDFHKLTIAGASGNNVRFHNGTKVGTGDGAQGTNGCTYQAAEVDLGDSVDFSADFSDPDVDEVLLYGSVVRRANRQVDFSDDATNGPNHELIGSVIDQSYRADIGRIEARNSQFSQTVNDADVTSPDEYASLLWNFNIDIENCTFLNNDDPTTDGVAHAIEHQHAGTFTYTGLVFINNEFDILFSAADLDLTINAAQSDEGVNSNPADYTNQSTGTVTIVNAVTLTVTVEDSSGDPVSGVRVRIEETDGTLITDGTTNTSGVFTDSYNFLSNTDVNVIVRLKGYIPQTIGSQITANGLSIPVTFIVDPIVNLP